ncbi:hypothetical protein [Faecalibaculum rodentium]|uniref:hypothetical protein n=2 Tax=Faecalibaculum rodentium TaxID=1702221 RepID=UPI0025A2C47F|nr:hypothetical protein [Faecalibaculum rodentium]
MLSQVRSIEIGGEIWFSLADLEKLTGRPIDRSVIHDWNLQTLNVREKTDEDKIVNLRLVFVNVDGLMEHSLMSELMQDPEYAVEMSEDDGGSEGSGTGQDPAVSTVGPAKEPLEEKHANSSYPRTSTGAQEAPRRDHPIYSREEIEMAEKGLEKVIIKYLTTPLPKNWEKLNPEERRAYLDGESDLQAEMVRDRVCLEEIIVECLRKKELLANVPFQKNLTKIMARQTDWVRQAGGKLYAPYGKGVGYRRKMK